MRPSAIGLVIALSLASFGQLACRGGVATDRTRTVAGGDAKVEGQVVSTVDGQPIYVKDVERLAYRSGLPMRDALHKLQDERLLRREAERRAVAGPAVDDVARRAAVQALLVSEADAVVVTDDDIRAAYTSAVARFERPEQRVVLHVLAALPKTPTPEQDAAAKAYATRILPELAAATDIDGFIAAHHGKTVDGTPIVCERLPALAKAGRLVKEFEDAMFALPAVGTAKEPVKTIYGWHAIRVLEITPAERTPYETAAKTLRQELLSARRTERIKQLVEALRRKYSVTFPENMREVLAKLEL